MIEIKYPFTEEQMKQVFETSLVDFAKNNGFNLKESDRKTFKVENMGGLFIFKDGKGFYLHQCAGDGSGRPFPVLGGI